MRKILIICSFLFSFFNLKAQVIRTYTNAELSYSFSDNLNKYSFYWGESFQNTKTLPFRVHFGLQYSLNSKSEGIYKSTDSEKMAQITLNKSVRYSTISAPAALEIFYKGVGVGAFQQLISYSGNKTFSENSITLNEGETIKTKGLSYIFGQKPSLSNGIFIHFTMKDSYTLKVGKELSKATFIKNLDKKETGFITLSDDLYFIGLRINLEK